MTYKPDAARQRMVRCRSSGEITGNGVAFDFCLCAHGALFELFREQSHSTSDILDAKAWLRSRRDVASIIVTAV